MPHAHSSYTDVICNVVFKGGLLSRVAIATALSCEGLLNDKQITRTLKHLVDQGELAKRGASYMFSPEHRAKMLSREREIYDDNFKSATKQRDAASKAKEAGKARERKRVAKAFKAAQVPIKRDHSALTMGLMAGL